MLMLPSPNAFSLLTPLPTDLLLGLGGNSGLQSVTSPVAPLPWTPLPQHSPTHIVPQVGGMQEEDEQQQQQQKKRKKKKKKERGKRTPNLDAVAETANTMPSTPPQAFFGPSFPEELLADTRATTVAEVTLKTSMTATAATARAAAIGRAATGTESQGQLHHTSASLGCDGQLFRNCKGSDGANTSPCVVGLDACGVEGEETSSCLLAGALLGGPRKRKPLIQPPQPSQAQQADSASKLQQEQQQPQQRYTTPQGEQQQQQQQKQQKQQQQRDVSMEVGIERGVAQHAQRCVSHQDTTSLKGQCAEAASTTPLLPQHAMPNASATTTLFPVLLGPAGVAADSPLAQLSVEQDGAALQQQQQQQYTTPQGEQQQQQQQQQYTTPQTVETNEE